MPSRGHNGHTGAKVVPWAVRLRTERRILDYAAKHCAGKFARVEVRFRGALCYIDVYTELQVPGGSAQDTPMHLCRIRYTGSEERWEFAWFSYAHEKYEPSFLITGRYQGTPEEAFATSTLFY
jgi:hypothetical protein